MTKKAQAANRKIIQGFIKKIKRKPRVRELQWKKITSSVYIAGASWSINVFRQYQGPFRRRERRQYVYVKYAGKKVKTFNTVAQAKAWADRVTCSCTPAKTHSHCGYCGHFYPEGICGVCKEAGIDGPTIRGTSARRCFLHQKSKV